MTTIRSTFCQGDRVSYVPQYRAVASGCRFHHSRLLELVEPLLHSRMILYLLQHAHSFCWLPPECIQKRLLELLILVLASRCVCNRDLPSDLQYGPVVHVLTHGIKKVGAYDVALVLIYEFACRIGAPAVTVHDNRCILVKVLCELLGFL